MATLIYWYVMRDLYMGVRVCNKHIIKNIWKLWKGQEVLLIAAEIINIIWASVKNMSIHFLHMGNF